jgi:hypothetical protein
LAPVLISAPLACGLAFVVCTPAHLVQVMASNRRRWFGCQKPGRRRSEHGPVEPVLAGWFTWRGNFRPALFRGFYFGDTVMTQVLS